MLRHCLRRRFVTETENGIAGDENKILSLINGEDVDDLRRERDRAFGEAWQQCQTDKDQCHCKLYAVFMYAFANEMFIHRVELRKRQLVDVSLFLSFSRAP